MIDTYLTKLGFTRESNDVYGIIDRGDTEYYSLIRFLPPLGNELNGTTVKFYVLVRNETIARVYLNKIPLHGINKLDDLERFINFVVG